MRCASASRRRPAAAPSQGRDRPDAPPDPHGSRRRRREGHRPQPAGLREPGLLTADEVSVKVAFWPLLSRRVEVRKIVLDGPALTIERDSDGKLNVARLPLRRRAREPSRRADRGAALLVSRIDIARGRAVFVDRKVTPGETVTTAIEDLQGRISDVGPTHARPLRARRAIPRGRRPATSRCRGRSARRRPTGSRREGAAQSGLRGEEPSRSRRLVALRLGLSRRPIPESSPLSGSAEGAPRSRSAIVGRAALCIRRGPPRRFPPLDGTYRARPRLAVGNARDHRHARARSRTFPSIEGASTASESEDPRVELRIETPARSRSTASRGCPGSPGRLPAGVKLGGRVRLAAKIEGPTSDLVTAGLARRGALLASRWPARAAARGRLGAARRSPRRGQEPMAGPLTIPVGKAPERPVREPRRRLDLERTGALTLVPSASRVRRHVALARSSPTSRQARVRLAPRRSTCAGVQAQPLARIRRRRCASVFAGSLHGRIALESRGLSWDAVSQTGKGEGRLSVTERGSAHREAHARSRARPLGRRRGRGLPGPAEPRVHEVFEARDLARARGRPRRRRPTSRSQAPTSSVAATGSLGLDRTLDYRGRIVLGPRRS